MIREKKKREIRKIIKYYKNLLALSDYRLLSRFKSQREDEDMNDCYAVIQIDNERKNIYLKLNKVDFARMRMGNIKRLCLHELLHSFFWELSELFDEVIGNDSFNQRKREALKRKFEDIEHRKIKHLVRVLTKLKSR